MLVVWQNPTTRRFVGVAQIDELTDGKFIFAYTEDAKSDDEFIRLAEFPDLESLYLVDALPAFLSNRIMSTRRSSFPEYRAWLGLEGQDDDLPIEILLRTGGHRVTDTYHIVETPRQTSDAFSTRFFVSGIRHIDGAVERLGHVKQNDVLELVDQPANPKNPEAKLIAKSSVGHLGWVPDWLVSQVRELEQNYELTCIVEKVNPDAPMHLRLLVKIEGILY